MYLKCEKKIQNEETFFKIICKLKNAGLVGAKTVGTGHLSTLGGQNFTKKFSRNFIDYS